MPSLDLARHLLYDARVKRFQDLEQFTDQDVEAAIARNDPEELHLASIVVALVSPDSSRAQALCVTLARHADSRVRAHAMVSLGHLARRFRALDETTIKPLIEAALEDADEYVRAHARSAADEIHQFLHWRIAGHVYGIEAESV